MSHSCHSPEPWILGDWERKREPGSHGKDYYEFHAYLDVSLADRERIVACVNACRGVPNEALHSLSILIETTLNSNMEVPRITPGPLRPHLEKPTTPTTD